MSTTVQAEASKPQRKMQECNRCKAAGYPNQPITFDNIGEDQATGKIKWKFLDENGNEHVHKGASEFAPQRKRVVDIAAVSDVNEAKRLLALGYKTSYPATIANIRNYVLVKREWASFAAAARPAATYCS